MQLQTLAQTYNTLNTYSGTLGYKNKVNGTNIEIKMWYLFYCLSFVTFKVHMTNWLLYFSSSLRNVLFSSKKKYIYLSKTIYLFIYILTHTWFFLSATILVLKSMYVMIFKHFWSSLSLLRWSNKLRKTISLRCMCVLTIKLCCFFLLFGLTLLYKFLF